MPKGKGKRKAQPPVPPSSEQQAQAEGLTLLMSKNNKGYLCVCLDKPGRRAGGATLQGGAPWGADAARWGGNSGGNGGGTSVGKEG